MKIEMNKAEEEEARLTGYALGELDAAETQAVEALLESSGEARETLEQIRATADLLTAEFSREPSLSLSEEQVDAITGEGKIVRGSFFSRHRNFLSMGAVAACACLFAAVGLKPYLDGLEDQVSAASELESLPASDPPGDRETVPMAMENPEGAKSETATSPPVGINKKDFTEGEIGEESFATGLADGLGMPQEGADSRRRKAKGLANPAIAGAAERRQLGRSDATEAAAGKPVMSAELVKPSAISPAPPSNERSQQAKENDASRERIRGSVVRSKPKSRVLGEPSAAPAPAAPADPYGEMDDIADAVSRPKTRAVAETRNFGLDMDDGGLVEQKLRGAKLKEESESLVRPQSDFAKRSLSKKPVDEVASGEGYGQLIDNPWVSTWADGLSTFAIDVDTGTYPNLRRFLKRRASLPPRDAVRIEEMVNYFNYDYPEPQGDAPFSVNMEVASCPWAKDHRLLRIGLRGEGIEVDQRPPSNLVFLIDVSGSMRGAEKLELLKRSMKAMVGQLNEDDRISIVTYAGQSGVVLEPTHGDQKEKITSVLEKLGAGGSTNGAAGITTAYSLAKANFVEGGTNRVILATDGDFNVGVTANGDLIRMVEERAREKVFLTVLGVGEGNLQEHRMEQIADKGNGSYHYLDSEREGEKVLVRGLGATLVTVAKDVKVQIDFNPAEVEKYRLIGYANRMMPDEAFNDPAADAGEIGAGHTVTALYEIVPAARGAKLGADSNTVSRYRKQGGLVESRETLTLKLKYKQPDSDESEPAIEVPLLDEGKDWAESSEDFRFAAAVAGFGLLLRDSDYAGLLNFDLVLELGREGVPEKGDEFGLRSEFIDLVEAAKSLSGTKE